VPKSSMRVSIPPSMRVSIPPKRYVSHIALVSSIHEPSICLEEDRCYTLMEGDVEVDSMITSYGSSIEYRDKVIGFS